tara:strand:- start:1222 stop:2337 length:1116 start_codon:yes stop_codon:yes gene_type:complete
MNKSKNNAVFSFYNTVSGAYCWWDQFPEEITQKLNKQNIQHKCFYRSFSENSIYPENEQNISKLDSWKWLLEIYRLSKKYDRVIFHTHSYYPPLKFYLLTLFSFKRQWIRTEHVLGDGAPKKWKKTVRTLLRQFKLMPKIVIAVSDAVAERNKLIHGNNVLRIHNGIKLIDPPVYSNKKSAKTFLYVGRLDPKKGIWLLIKAFNILINQHHKKELHAHIVGGGPLLDELQSYAFKHKLTNNIFFHGYQSDPSQYYIKADCIVIPTIVKDACPLVALEARSHNLPILYANRGGLPEIAGRGSSPLLGLTPELIAKSISIISDDKILYKKLINVGRDGIEYFSIDRMTDEYVHFYTKFLQNKAEKLDCNLENK